MFCNGTERLLGFSDFDLYLVISLHNLLSQEDHEESARLGKEPYYKELCEVHHFHCCDLVDYLL